MLKFYLEADSMLYAMVSHSHNYRSNFLLKLFGPQKLLVQLTSAISNAAYLELSLCQTIFQVLLVLN